MARFSAIIPALDEERTIARCLGRLRALDATAQLIVADGGSRDATRRLAREQGAIVCSAPGGRGPQCNAGAALASGEVLLFLHADTELPAGAFSTLDAWFRDKRVQIGTFGLRFDLRHWSLDLAPWVTRFDTVFTRFGDQAIAVRRTFFDALGGFPPWPLFEDTALLQKARRRTRIYSFPGCVTTSARRYVEGGILRQYLRNVGLILCYLLGASPAALAGRYRRAAQGPAAAALIVLARYPRPGQAKTRLASTLGGRAAMDFYAWCANRTFREARRLGRGVRRYVFYSEESSLARLRRWVGRGYFLAPQADGDLGRRLERAFETVFAHGAGRAVVAAADVPDLSAGLLAEALRALEARPAVIGPALDGGYYLLGLREPHAELFQGISWSTPQVLEQTERAAEALGLAVHRLPALRDIDTEEDLHAWSAGRAAPNWRPGAQAQR